MRLADYAMRAAIAGQRLARVRDERGRRVRHPDQPGIAQAKQANVEDGDDRLKPGVGESLERRAVLLGRANPQPVEAFAAQRSDHIHQQGAVDSLAAEWLQRDAVPDVGFAGPHAQRALQLADALLTLRYPAVCGE